MVDDLRETLLGLTGSGTSSGAPIRRVTRTPDGLDARGLPAEQIDRIALRHGITLRELAQRTSGLEESFLALTARERKRV